jgi:hypothetical protein
MVESDNCRNRTLAMKVCSFQGSITPIICRRVQFYAGLRRSIYASHQRECELHAEGIVDFNGEPIAQECNMRFQLLAVLITTSSFAAAQRSSSAGGSPEHHSDVEISRYTLKPSELPAQDVSQLYLPAGFRLQKVR